MGIPFGFQGARYDEETGLYYFRNRYYDPRTGRFLQRDPKHDPANVGNSYTFVGNSPISRRDPLGLQQSGPGRSPASDAVSGTRKTQEGRQPPPDPAPSPPSESKVRICGRDIKGNPDDTTLPIPPAGGTGVSRGAWIGGRFVCDEPDTSKPPWAIFHVILQNPGPSPQLDRPPPGPDRPLTPNQVDEIARIDHEMQGVQERMDLEEKLRTHYLALRKLKPTLPPPLHSAVDAVLRALEARLSELDSYFEPAVD